MCDVADVQEVRPPSVATPCYGLQQQQPTSLLARPAPGTKYLLPWLLQMPRLHWRQPNTEHRGAMAAGRAGAGPGLRWAGRCRAANTSTAQLSPLSWIGFAGGLGRMCSTRPLGAMSP